MKRSIWEAYKRVKANKGAAGEILSWEFTQKDLQAPRGAWGTPWLLLYW